MDDAEIYIFKEAIHNYPKCRFLQIGTNYGYTVFSILSDIYKVGGFLDTVDFNNHWNRNRRKKATKWNTHVEKTIRENCLHSVNVHIRGSNIFFKKQCDKTYDIIFIDGDHTFRQSKLDLKHSLRVLLPGGTIFMHDIRPTVRGNSKTCYDVFRKFKSRNYTKTLIKTKYVLGVIKHIESNEVCGDN